ncbi:MAG TPA: hypothetical protein VFW33_16200 [Gemmataceae bacterium]|nr:hypothetical protein [Gemmataceae bacterium]
MQLFMAYSKDAYITSGPTLDEVLAWVAGIVSPDVAEDVCVWQGYRLVALVNPDGAVTRFDRTPASRLPAIVGA